MNTNINFKSIAIACLALTPFFGWAQEQQEQLSEQKDWTLQSCIDYALEQNINLQKSKILLEQSRINTKQAKAQMFPSLSASTGHTVRNTPMPEDDSITKTSYTGNYGANASWILFNGFRRKYNIEQQKLMEESQDANIANAQLDMKLSILTCYIQILYAKESIKVSKSSLETSKKQRDRGEELLNAGSFSKSDLAQLEAQYSSDKYQLIVAENNLEEKKLQLKQILELDIAEDIDIPEIEIDESEISQPLTSKEMIYATALSVNPTIKNSKLNMQIAELDTKKAKSAYYPTLSLNAGVSTGHNSLSDLDYGKQIKYNFGESIGLTLSYSIFDNRERKSTLEKARLNETLSNLEDKEVEKNLLKTIESAYLDAVAAQNSYIAASENLKAAESSYELIDQKYNLGMKNPFELLSEKNSLLNTQVSKLQAKYMALLNLQILNLYQDLPVGF
ncbi:MAG TPA: TolC family protein [Paludibacteraceae bacterium]|jgi:outer membrane protein|nr:TolC family protein [Paludibacteraceae bacterium]HOU67851.1 TolC family protein [Paludibacteraceae bacterium]HPH62437.1 TolC family protein [Paludibacteraceae bacterium]HQF49676.1 TolC family protein [Paludibacteraceae bacterium]